MTHYIYVLKDPSSHKVRYVGRTTTAALRKNAHCSRDGLSPKSIWVWLLRTNGMKPVFEIIDEVKSDDSATALKLAVECEVQWIKHYVDEVGASLLNVPHGPPHRSTRLMRTALYLYRIKLEAQEAGNKRCAWLAETALNEMPCGYRLEH